eukprot:m.281614 g.281614  ORF g.281614 m.281614 type:complete len:358 (-) comp16174_c0_seq2:1298-2371(-)
MSVAEATEAGATLGQQPARPHLESPSPAAPTAAAGPPPPRAGRPGPSRAVQLKIRRADAGLLTRDAVLGLASRYGEVVDHWISGARAVVLFAEAEAAAGLHSYLLGAKTSAGFGRARLFGSFVDPAVAATPPLASADRIASVTSDLEQGVREAAATAGLAGVTLLRDFVTDAEEAALLAAFDRAELWDTGPEASRASRRTQHFGFAYNYQIQGAAADRPVEPFPPAIASVARRLAAVAKWVGGVDQATLQEYTPGQGIPPHIDTVWAFGPALASLSLLSDCVMRFRPVFGVLNDPEAAADLLLPRRSLILLTGPARYHFSHSIPARKHDVVDGAAVARGRRLSLTFRSMLGRAPPEE